MCPQRVVGRRKLLAMRVDRMNGRSSSVFPIAKHLANCNPDILAVLAGRGAVGRGPTRDPA